MRTFRHGPIRCRPCRCRTALPRPPYSRHCDSVRLPPPRVQPPLSNAAPRRPSPSSRMVRASPQMPSSDCSTRNVFSRLVRVRTRVVSALRPIVAVVVPGRVRGAERGYAAAVQTGRRIRRYAVERREGMAGGMSAPCRLLVTAATLGVLHPLTSTIAAAANAAAITAGVPPPPAPQRDGKPWWWSSKS